MTRASRPSGRRTSGCTTRTRESPNAFPEWGLWAIDDPNFIQKMADFVRAHKRVELVSYFDSNAGSTWDLAAKPRAMAAYRRLITPLG